MRARDILGKRVVAVRQHRDKDANVRPCVELDEIEFSDGTILRFLVAEGSNDYHVCGIVVSKSRRS